VLDLVEGLKDKIPNDAAVAQRKFALERCTEILTGAACTALTASVGASMPAEGQSLMPHRITIAGMKCKRVCGACLKRSCDHLDASCDLSGGVWLCS
jgi:hypothetical protein